MASIMLTTVDNPFDPFTHYDEWYAFDERMGYNSTGLLARVVNFSHELSDADRDLAIEEGIKEIVEINALGLHRIAKDDSEDIV